MRHRLAVFTVLAVLTTLVPTAPVQAATIRLSERCDVLIVGGTTGGVAAAISAARRGVHVCMVSRFRTLGGQFTTQAVPAPDETYLQFPSSYELLEQLVRDFYGADNPGECWVSRLCASPAVYAQAIETLLAPYSANGTLSIYRGWDPIQVTKRYDKVTSVTFAPSHTREAAVVPFGEDTTLHIDASVTIDATDLGDLYPLAGAAFIIGDTTAYAEPDAVDDVSCVQPFTYGFFLQSEEGSSAPVPAPAGYDPDNYSFNGWPMYTGYRGFVSSGIPLSFWAYRRTQTAPDVSLINWGGGNDYAAGATVLGDNREQVLAAGRDHALGFLRWLQTEAPRDDGGNGYPELTLRADWTGTTDGLSVEPYWREGRHLVSMQQIVEQDIISSVPAFDGSVPAVVTYNDTVGIGRYPFDLHPCRPGPPGEPPAVSGAFQIPLGALIPRTIDGLIAGGKSLGATHITNGATRVHPIEWTIGTAAGAVAADATIDNVEPRDFLAGTRLRRLQYELLIVDGSTLYWWADLIRPCVAGDCDTNLAKSDPTWPAAQMLAVLGVTDRAYQTRLGFAARRLVDESTVAHWTERLFGDGVTTGDPTVVTAWLTERTGSVLEAPEVLDRGSLAILLWEAIAPTTLDSGVTVAPLHRIEGTE